MLATHDIEQVAHLGSPLILRHIRRHVVGLSSPLPSRVAAYFPTRFKERCYGTLGITILLDFFFFFFQLQRQDGQAVCTEFQDTMCRIPKTRATWTQPAAPGVPRGGQRSQPRCFTSIYFQFYSYPAALGMGGGQATSMR